jgi:two-component system sensor histidine kinase TctE
MERSRKKIADMLELIGRWLTVSKVEGGQLATARQSVFWQEVVPEVLEGLAVAAKDKQVTLHDEVPRTVPPVVGDVPALRMLLANLVGNAVKYNRPGGRVTIRAEVDRTTGSLSVADTGVGIPPEDQERVFDEFYRVPGQMEDGTGMGLPICRRIAEELGGQLTVVSRPGGGSEFTVVLPRASVDGANGA